MRELLPEREGGDVRTVERYRKKKIRGMNRGGGRRELLVVGGTQACRG